MIEMDVVDLIFGRLTSVMYCCMGQWDMLPFLWDHPDKRGVL